MKAALIPPIGLLDQFCRGREYHLALTHLLQYGRYFKYYLEASKTSYVILDNSAHEFQEGQEIKNLLKNAFDIGASEVIFPDKLFDSEKTVENAVASVDYILEHDFERLPRFGMVPQGLSIPDLLDCANGLAKNYNRARLKDSSKFGVPMLGVSKDYEKFDGGLLRVLERVIFPVANDMGAEIHLFGWGRQMWAYKEIADKYGSLIRSIDSAKPFIFGRHQIILDPTIPEPKYPRRSAGYFFETFSPMEIMVSEMNIRVFDQIVEGIYDPRLSSL